MSRRTAGAAWAAAVGILLAAGPPAGAWEITREGQFDGTWTVSGETYSMEFGDDADTVTIYRFTGPVLVRTQNGFAPSLDSECLGFSAPRTGGVGRCTLTDPEGDRIFCELSAAMTPGVLNVGGTIVSGTGKYRGMGGTLRFQAVPGPKRPGKGSAGQTMTIFGTWKMP
jgi:hypothetical protein